ncbi:MAG: serine/threonine protein kinase [Polyangiaceae bacterium]|nr:serine/threonine protein kinase [Polyangiaceae bacterium]
MVDVEEEDLLEGTAYRSREPLGKGGMGLVVLAEHRMLGTELVVKLMHERLAADPSALERMRVEGQAMARLCRRSPHLVEVKDFGITPSGVPFLAMERLVGRTLRAELAACGPLPAARALELVRELCRGLAVLHAAGIVHRDVKLDNVILAEDGAGGRAVKLLDFGIVKVLSAAAGVAPTRYPTEQGAFVGTPRWSAPEQIKGANVDCRTDVYAVGLVLYTLVCGRGPFDHLESPVDIMRAHIFDAPAPPSAYAKERLPPELDEVVLRALSKSPDERPATAAELETELGAVAASAAAAWGEGADAGADAPSPGWLETELMQVAHGVGVAEAPAVAEPHPGPHARPQIPPGRIAPTDPTAVSPGVPVVRPRPTPGGDTARGPGARSPGARVRTAPLPAPAAPAAATASAVSGAEEPTVLGTLGPPTARTPGAKRDTAPRGVVAPADPARAARAGRDPLTEPRPSRGLGVQVLLLVLVVAVAAGLTLLLLWATGCASAGALNPDPSPSTPHGPHGLVASPRG